MVNAYGVMAGVLIGLLVTLAQLYLAAYLPVLNPAVSCAWSACHSVYRAVLCVRSSTLLFKVRTLRSTTALLRVSCFTS